MKRSARRIIVRPALRIEPDPTIVVRQRNGQRWSFHRLLSPGRLIIGEIVA